jgi:hypothetical protein
MAHLRDGREWVDFKFRGARSGVGSVISDERQVPTSGLITLLACPERLEPSQRLVEATLRDLLD